MNLVKRKKQKTAGYQSDKKTRIGQNILPESLVIGGFI